MSRRRVTRSVEPTAGPSTNNNDASYTLLAANRSYAFGNDRLKGSRIWIQANASNAVNYYLFTQEEEYDNVKIFKCSQCRKYEKTKKSFCSSVKVVQLENGEIQVWESCDHYPSCAVPLSDIEKYQARYHRSPGTSQSARSRTSASLPPPSRSRTNRTLGQSTSRSRTKAVATSSQNQQPSTSHQPRKVINRSRTIARTPTVQKRNNAESNDRRATSVVPTKRNRKRARSTTDADVVDEVDIAPRTEEQEPSSSDFYDAQDAFINQQNDLARAYLPILAPLNQAPSTSQQQPQTSDAVVQPESISQPFPYELLTLRDDQTIIHCLPSTQQLRVICDRLNLEYTSDHQLFWHATYSTDMIKTTSTIGAMGEVTSLGRNIGFQALSLFFTTTEKYAFRIQEVLKSYIYQNLLTDEKSDLFLSSLCGYDMTDLHLYALTKVVSIRVIMITEKNGIKIFGDAFDQSIPSITLYKNTAGIYWPIRSIDN